ncbi:cytochrome P460 family protein [Acidicapsa acidisoli]|uniref:cytochrome P460 family protein n=1 Tax=Acidicapsa acidisoli TaxID=1615681 RepID=UPI0021E0F91C|nr:cytochrome P460 family protein [Acidicapsa acidisoli]
MPGGLSFSEFKGFEDWSVIAVSQNGPNISAILGNPTVIDAFKCGIPGNGKPFPDGSKMAKVHCIPTKDVTETGGPLVPSGLRDIEFMLKDSKRFRDSHGWGYGDFHCEASSNSSIAGDLEISKTNRRRGTMQNAGLPAMSPCRIETMSSLTMGHVDAS